MIVAFILRLDKRLHISFIHQNLSMRKNNRYLASSVRYFGHLRNECPFKKDDFRGDTALFFTAFSNFEWL